MTTDYGSAWYILCRASHACGTPIVITWYVTTPPRNRHPIPSEWHDWKNKGQGERCPTEDSEAIDEGAGAYLERIAMPAEIPPPAPESQGSAGEGVLALAALRVMLTHNTTHDIFQI